MNVTFKTEFTVPNLTEQESENIQLLLVSHVLRNYPSAHFVTSGRSFDGQVPELFTEESV